MKKLGLKVVQYEITLDDDEVIATITRTGNGWAFRDLEKDWIEIVQGPIDTDDMIYVFYRLRNEEAKSSTALQDLPQEPRPTSES